MEEIIFCLTDLIQTKNFSKIVLIEASSQDYSQLAFVVSKLLLFTLYIERSVNATLIQSTLKKSTLFDNDKY